eukprot:6208980-Pleurochrysis_carterae.AAC.1
MLVSKVAAVSDVHGALISLIFRPVSDQHMLRCAHLNAGFKHAEADRTHIPLKVNAVPFLTVRLGRNEIILFTANGSQKFSTAAPQQFCDTSCVIRKDN